MKAMIFAAGLGTRLRPLTDNRPKALVEVDGVPMLERVILKLKDASISRIIVNVHHLAKQIVDFLTANNYFGLDITISDESDCLLDTGGGVLKARRWLDDGEPFLLHNADILTDFDLRPMMELHEREGNDMTLLVANRESSRRLLFDDSMRMRGWKNMSSGEVIPANADSEELTPLAFGGVHIISPGRFFPLLESFSSEPKFSITPFYAANCDKLKIAGYEPKEEYGWFDIGTPQKLMTAENYLRKK